MAVQYTAPVGTKQIYDSKVLTYKVTQSTQTALSRPSLQPVVDQANLKMVQPSVIVSKSSSPS